MAGSFRCCLIPVSRVVGCDRSSGVSSDRAYSGSLIAPLVSPCWLPDASGSFRNVRTWRYRSGECRVVSGVVIGSLGDEHAFLVCPPDPQMADFSTTAYKAAEEEIMRVIHEWESVRLYTQAVGDYVQ